MLLVLSDSKPFSKANENPNQIGQISFLNIFVLWNDLKYLKESETG